MTAEVDVILASASPRRRELLATLGLAFEVLPANIDETVLANESPTQYVERVALAKGLAVAKLRPENTIISCDTAVVLGAVILGKPEGKAAAQTMLQTLSGQVHTVLSTVVVMTGAKISQTTVQTNVHFATLSNDDIEQYCATSEPYDKAGAYAIQGLAQRFVRKIDGSYSAVVGLPLYELDLLLSEHGIATQFEA